MELSISRSKVVFIALAVGVFFWFAKGRDAVSSLPPEVREVLPGAPAPDPGPAPRASPAPAEPEPEAEARPEPARPEPEPEPARPERAGPAPAADGPAPKPERTPDEKARSSMGMALAYAENGRFDKAYETLEAAGRLPVSDEVRRELATAEAVVTRRMKERKAR